MTFNHYDTVPKSMPKDEARKVVAILKGVVKAAEMKNANFGIGQSPNPDITPTEYVRAATDLHHRTLIIDPVQSIIDRYENFLEDGS